MCFTSSCITQITGNITNKHHMTHTVLNIAVNETKEMFIIIYNCCMHTIYYYDIIIRCINILSIFMMVNLIGEDHYIC